MHNIGKLCSINDTIYIMYMYAYVHISNYKCNVCKRPVQLFLWAVRIPSIHF